MAVGGVACTGCSGEDYAVPGYNALVLETNDPREFTALFSELHANPGVNAAFDEPGVRRRSNTCGRRSSNVCSCLVSTSWLNEPQSQLLRASPRAQQARSHPRLHQDDSTSPQLVEWMADRLKRRHSSREDCTRAHAAIVK